MKTFGRLLTVCSMVVLLGACSTISFNNGSEGEVGRSGSNWHHVGILELVEFSSPVDMRRKCRKKNWSSVTTKMNFVQALIHGFAGAVYSPWEVSYTCAN